MQGQHVLVSPACACEVAQHKCLSLFTGVLGLELGLAGLGTETRLCCNVVHVFSLQSMVLVDNAQVCGSAGLCLCLSVDVG